MIIILDTNLLHSDWVMRSDDAKAFLDFVKYTGDLICVPCIVWEELRKNYQDDIVKKHSDYEKFSKLFGSSLVETPALKIVELNYGEETEKYLVWLKSKLLFKEDDNIIPYGDFTVRIAQRAIHKVRPFNKENNNELKDVIIWETILDVVANKSTVSSNEVVFITKDGNGFDAEKIARVDNSGKQQRGEKQKGVLHPALQIEIDKALEVGSTDHFYYYDSFSKFLAAHYEPIKDVDSASAMNFINDNVKILNAQIWDKLNANRDLILSTIIETNFLQELNIDFEQVVIGEVVGIRDFYIWSKKETTVLAAATIAIPVELPLQYQFSYSKSPENFLLKSFIEAKVSIEYNNGKPQSISIDSTELIDNDELVLPRQRIYDSETYRTYIEKLEAAFFNSHLPSSLKLFDLELFEKNKKLENPPSKYLPRPHNSNPINYKKNKQKSNKGKK